MTTSIYLAGASKELAFCESLRDRLTTAGNTITFDWMATVRANLHRPDREIGREERRNYALADLRGVADAGIFWLVTPEKPSIGCWVELGAALMASRSIQGPQHSPGRPLVVVSGKWATLFQDTADRCFPTHEEALAMLLQETFPRPGEGRLVGQ